MGVDILNGIEKLRLRMSADGDSLKQDKINTTVNYIKNTFQDDPTYQKNGVQIVGGNTIYPRLWNYKKDDNLSPTFEIQTQLTDEFKRGQLLIIDGTYWLCLKNQCFHDMYWTGKIKQCTHLLHYQDIKTKELQSSWAVLERPYSRTLNTGEVITTSEMEFKAKLPYNDSTKKINLDRRILTGTEYNNLGNEIGSVYQITGRDASSQVINGEGFLVLNMTQVEFNADKDNLDLMVADFILPDSPTTKPPIPDATLLKSTITGSNSIKCGGSARTYKPIFYQSDGITPDDTVIPIWNLSIDSEHTNKVISVSNGNFIQLSCIDDTTMIGLAFKLKLVDSMDLYSPSEIEIKVVSI